MLRTPLLVSALLCVSLPVAAQLIDHLKKAEMAKEAERLLDGTGFV